MQVMFVTAAAGREIDQSKMLHVVGEYLADMNAGNKKPHHLVLFQFALEHVARISAVVSQPGKQACWCVQEVALYASDV
jgi:hypothetical protein